MINRKGEEGEVNQNCVPVGYPALGETDEGCERKRGKENAQKDDDTV